MPGAGSAKAADILEGRTRIDSGSSGQSRGNACKRQDQEQENVKNVFLSQNNPQLLGMLSVKKSRSGFGLREFYPYFQEWLGPAKAKISF